MTPREQDTIETIQRYIEEHGHSPTLRELAHELGSNTITGSLHHRLHNLKRKGYLTWERYQHRSLRVTQPARETFYAAAYEYARCPSLEGFNVLLEAFDKLHLTPGGKSR